MNKIHDGHLRRSAVVYLRQSSMGQVRNNLESQRLQYALTDRATALGWKRVEVIDSDLGVSAASGSGRRPGFERLLSLVALGQVGLILSREVSRLSRNDQDWCRLLEVCQVFDTLIGDDEQIYDLAQMDDQLVLGIKGTLSVVELGVLRMRMHRGREAKAARGSLKFRLPSGYVHDADGQPVKDPDERVREAIALVFRRFRQLQNGRQLFMSFHDERVEMPVYQYQGGKLRAMWRVPTLLYLVGIIKNPFYAGAYVYGRRSRETVMVDSKVAKRIGKLQPAEQCRVFLREHHEGYIDWTEYQENVAILQRNAPRKQGGDTVTSARTGSGLLVGLLRCGHCGRKLKVNYWGRSGAAPRYVCRGTYADAGDGCIGFAGTIVEKHIEQQVLDALSPLGVEASLLASDRLSGRDNDKVALARQRAKQLRYEANRAFEQYDEVDPRNRLVAAELERRWNAKLVAADDAESELGEVESCHAPLDEALLARLRHLGEHFEQAWRSAGCSMSLKKKIVRVVIEEVVVRRDANELAFVVHWTGGAHTSLRVERPAPGSERKTSADALAIIRVLALHYEDAVIAGVLNRRGLTTGHGKKWNSARVTFARRRYDIQPDLVSPEAAGMLSLKGAASYCRVSESTIQKLVTSGLVRNTQTIAQAPYEIAKADLDSDLVQRLIARLHTTGRLDVPGALATEQRELFT
jgi:DNA invertase Pin-like site-specific DNA recombinase